jgi:hypothetical protein
MCLDVFGCVWMMIGIGMVSSSEVANRQMGHELAVLGLGTGTGAIEGGERHGIAAGALTQTPLSL